MTTLAAADVYWLWRIYSADAPDQALEHGIQHTRLLASPVEVAQERMAVYAYGLMMKRRAAELVGLRCKAWRSDGLGRPGVAQGDSWAQRLERAVAA